MKHIVIISDLHTGSWTGLTPPEWQYNISKNKDKWIKNRQARLRMQQEAWTKYEEMCTAWYKPDILLVNGDCIEGTQRKDDGVELLTRDLQEQTNIATRCINKWRAKKILMTYGTAYHTSESTDWENIIAKDVNAEIGGHLFFEYEGVKFSAKHKIGSSATPTGRATPLLKSLLWNVIKDEPKVDCLIRSHVHYYSYIETAKQCAFSTPCLQLFRGRYGVRQCEGEVHWGMIRLTVHKGQITNREVVICNLVANKPKLLKIK